MPCKEFHCGIVVLIFIITVIFFVISENIKKGHSLKLIIGEQSCNSKELGGNVDFVPNDFFLNFYEDLGCDRYETYVCHNM